MSTIGDDHNLDDEFLGRGRTMASPFRTGTKHARMEGCKDEVDGHQQSRMENQMNGGCVHVPQGTQALPPLWGFNVWGFNKRRLCAISLSLSLSN